LWSQVGPSSIQISEIESYLRMVGIEECDTKMKYLRLVQQLDEIHLTHIASKAK